MNALIPGYRIIKLLGEGGMAKVYLAVQESFDRQVALKIMAPELAKGDPQYGERFVREARIVAQLMHPHIVTVFEVGEHDGLHYLSMEYIAGSDLRLRRDSLTLKQNLHVVKQIATALEFAHKKGYIHRDIKPENILIDEQDERAVLTDFGIARIAGTQENLTQTGTAIGTPNFMSPEQALGKPIDHRSDLYSLGVVLFYVITGRVPFTADSAVAIGLKHAVEPIPRLEGAFIQFQPVLEKIMAKQAERRYQSGQEFADIIDSLILRLSPETEQLWRESCSQATTPPAANAAVAPPIPIKAAPPKQPTPIIARRQHSAAHNTAPKFYVEPPSKRYGIKFFLLLILALASAALLKPEWIAPLQEQLFATLAPEPIISAPSNELASAKTAIKNDLAGDTATTKNETAATTAPSVDESNIPPAEILNTNNSQFDQLKLAKQLLDAGDLIEPEAQNAESVYRDLLQQDSNNAAAKEGLIGVGIALATRGIRYAEAGDLNRAQRDYERALLLAPRDRDVQILKQRMALLARDQDANDLVVKAKAAMKTNRWLLPDGDNAQDYFQRALAMQPANRDAINGSKELEQTIANRIRQLWQRKQYAEASDLLALAQKRYIASDILDAVAAQTVAPVNNKPRRGNDNDNGAETALAAPAAGLPQISNLSVSMQTDPVSNAKFLQASFKFSGASNGLSLSARYLNNNTKKSSAAITVTLSVSEGETQFTVATLDDKFADGQYLLQIDLGDKKLADVVFSVGR